MLVLSRRDGEKIVIGGGIEVVLIHSRKGRASIGIEAPKDLPVDREEVLRQKSGRAGN
ncbi:carbon storage regulator [Roseiconus lacunae]|uniref:carbon storage regulator n=1 Tax=Roseiconus lacunae TaxID=2605694 RepID=UPI0033153611